MTQTQNTQTVDPLDPFADVVRAHAWDAEIAKDRLQRGELPSASRPAVVAILDAVCDLPCDTCEHPATVHDPVVGGQCSDDEGCDCTRFTLPAATRTPGPTPSEKIAEVIREVTWATKRDAAALNLLPPETRERIRRLLGAAANSECACGHYAERHNPMSGCAAVFGSEILCDCAGFRWPETARPASDATTPSDNPTPVADGEQPDEAADLATLLDVLADRSEQVLNYSATRDRRPAEQLAADLYASIRTARARDWRNADEITAAFRAGVAWQARR